MSSEITELISALRDGTMSLDEVAQRFRERSWPRRNTEKLATYLDLAAAAERDPDPYLEGSFDEVAMAFHRGELSDREYEALAQAMADSMRREDRSKDPQN
jgi:predicted Ser/Thr protein kinase